jgi:hypothetical protein
MDPSDMPSDVPSVAPSFSDMPSDMPSSGGTGATTDAPLPSDMPSDMPSSGGGMTVPPTAPAITGYECSVCLPGMNLSLPDMIVDIPEGIEGIEGITQLPCSIIDQGVMDRPDLFTEETCQQLRDLFMDPCGCVFPGETIVPEPTTTTDPPVSGGTTACTICPEGQEITTPDAVVSIPDDISLPGGVSFATCSLVEGALESNPDIVDEATCASLQAFYAELCGCMPVDATTTVPTEDPTPPDFEEDTSKAGWQHVIVSAMVAIISSVWMI